MRTAQPAAAVQREEKNEIRYFDYTLLFIVIFLVGFGLVMLYSVSAYEAQIKFKGDGAYYLKKQAAAVCLGLIAMFVVSWIPYKTWYTWHKPLFILAHVLCIAVLVAGTSGNGSTRWLQIGPVSFQPSEAVKIIVIIFMAAKLSRMPRQSGRFSNLLKLLGMNILLIGMIAVSNLSTAVIIAGICVLMMFVTSPKFSHFFVLAGMGIAAVGVGILAQSYRGGRIRGWLNPELYPDDAYQTLQGLYAIGSGGFFGKGLGASIQKLGYVPEAENDFIFTIICEELGLFGAICVILLFILMIWRFIVIAGNAPDLFGSMLVVGVMAHIMLQVILNIAVVTNTIPNTGVTLPFISYGGTSVSFLLAEMGLVFNVSRSIHITIPPSMRREGR